MSEREREGAGRKPKREACNPTPFSGRWILLGKGSRNGREGGEESPR